MMAETQIVGAEIGRAMRQEADARGRAEGLLLRKLREDFLDGAIARTDEQVGDLRLCHAGEEIPDLLEAFDDADMGARRALQPFCQRHALAAALAGARVDDQPGAPCRRRVRPHAVKPFPPVA